MGLAATTRGLSLAGDTLATLPTPFDPVSVSSAAKRERVRRFTRADGSLEIGSAYMYPDEYPLFARLLVSRAGNLWVMAYPAIEEPISSWRLASTYAFLVEDGGARWRVLSPRGEVLAEVRTPHGFFPLEVGDDYILGVSKDELDVETVSVYSLAR